MTGAMAPRQSTNTGPNGDISTVEIVFSCGICQKLVSDVYFTKESNHGFNSSDHDESGVVTKFWMADCSHTFCGTHLEGGGAPFHRKDQQPSAPCPVCVVIHPQRTLRRELFGIRGLKPGEYAEEIPEMYFKCPPMSLDAGSPEMTAMKFQYSQMREYSKSVALHWRSEQRKRRILESTFSKERREWHKQESAFKERIAAMEKAEAKLRKWEQRRDMINHYLGLVGKMGGDINRMRSQLAQVGLHVPEGHYAFNPSKNNVPNTQQQQVQTHGKSRGDSAATLVGEQHHRSSSSRKRRHSIHDQYADDKENQDQLAPQVHRRNSRELMPPPLPRPRQPLQQPPPNMCSSDRPSGRPFDAFSRNPATTPREVIQIYDNGGWNDSQSTLPVSEHDYAPSGEMPAQARIPHALVALPFRPSQMQKPDSRPVAHEERVEPYYVDDVDARYQIPASSAAAPDHGTIPHPARRTDHRRPYSRIEKLHDHARLPVSQEAADPRISYFNADYVTMAQQSGEHAPREMKGFRRAAARPDTMQRPPARGILAPPPLPRRTDVPRSSIGEYSMPPSAPGSCAPSRSGSSAQRNRILLGGSFDPQLSHIRGVRRANASQPAYQRPGVPPSEAGSYVPSRSGSRAQRVPPGSSFDPQLSQIRGVRGASASQTYTRQGMSSSRPPDGRRSVLR